MTIDVYERDSDSLFFRVEFHNLISSHLHAHAAAEAANGPTSHYGNYSIHHAGAGFMNRFRLCQLTAAILTSDLKES